MDKTKISFAASYRALGNYRREVRDYQPTLRMRMHLWLEMRVQAIADYWRARKEW